MAPATGEKFITSNQTKNTRINKNTSEEGMKKKKRAKKPQKLKMADNEIATATNRRIQISDAIYLRKKKHAIELKNKKNSLNRRNLYNNEAPTRGVKNIKTE